MADDELDETVRRADPDRWLASRFIADPAARADVIALYAFDNELARARVVASNPIVAEIRLTWWREALHEIFSGRSVRRQPVADALARAVKRREWPCEPLEAMIDARIDVLEMNTLAPDEALRWADAVGGSAAVLATLCIDPAANGEAARPAGRAWGLAMMEREGVAVSGDLPALVRERVHEADQAAQGLSATTFPAVAYASLLRDTGRRGAMQGLARRFKLLSAVLRGRL